MYLAIESAGPSPSIIYSVAMQCIKIHLFFTISNANGYISNRQLNVYSVKSMQFRIVVWGSNWMWNMKILVTNGAFVVPEVAINPVICVAHSMPKANFC